ncbi:VIR protein [Plasmodium vivax]|uniref:VIR protein n=2 Tax=Plasmodium vivax TaxID=5855 RepID=A0A1G4H8H2_PLAVI|nr:variable surface protein Vir4 [Plasmodium vivax Brazil I]SCO71192.1 VIR protein [Plasmodium vivax]
MDDTTEVLKTLPSYKQYTEFNNDIDNDLNRYSKYCDVIKSHFAKYPGLDTVCKKFARNFTSLSTVFLHDNIKDKRCDYLNYWAYDQIIDIINGRSDLIYYDAFPKILTVWNSMKNMNFWTNKCNSDDILPHVTVTDFVNRKDLHDYCEDCETIKNEIIKLNNGCNEYCNFLLSKVDLFKHFDGICPNANTSECPKFFVTCKECNPETLFKELQCKEKKECIATPKVPRTGVETEGQTLKEEHALQGHVSQEQTSQEDGRESPITGEDNSAPFKFELSSYNSNLILASPLFGSLFFLFFYKFTPLGTWVDTNILRKKKNITYNFDENMMRELFEHQNEHLDIDLQNRRYNLIYNPSLNL